MVDSITGVSQGTEQVRRIQQQAQREQEAGQASGASFSEVLDEVSLSAEASDIAQAQQEANDVRVALEANPDVKLGLDPNFDEAV